MSQAVLRKNEIVSVRVTLLHLIIVEVNSEYEHIKQKELDDDINSYHSKPVPITEVLSEEEDYSNPFDLGEDHSKDHIDSTEQNTVDSMVKAVYKKPLTYMLIHT